MTANILAHLRTHISNMTYCSVETRRTSFIKVKKLKNSSNNYGTILFTWQLGAYSIPLPSKVFVLILRALKISNNVYVMLVPASQ